MQDNPRRTGVGLGGAGQHAAADGVFDGPIDRISAPVMAAAIGPANRKDLAHLKPILEQPST